jgi:hypothetical protein
MLIEKIIILMKENFKTIVFFGLITIAKYFMRPINFCMFKLFLNPRSIVRAYKLDTHYSRKAHALWLLFKG